MNLHVKAKQMFPTHYSTKATSKQERPIKFGVPDKKVVFFPYKRAAFLSGTPNFLGPSYFESALTKLALIGIA